MASAELQQFLEDRLVDLDPSMDLSPGSPAQTKFISPILSYLGTDPFETDIEKFITDRFAQEFPDVYGDDPGALRDVVVNPLRLILEPFKRETQSVRRGQSLTDPSLLSDDDADALVANVFDSRDRGGYAVGQARLYFPNPTDVRVEVSNKIFSDTGLNFLPTNPVSITAELMLFNREGTLFYFDVPARAEKAGAGYNIDAGTLAGMEGVPNLVRVTNLKKFSGGSERQDNVTFVSAAEVSLTERSLGSPRGTVARLNTVFKGQLRAAQVIGAKDPEMQRDIIGAVSPGHAWITGVVELYKDIAYVRARTIEGSISAIPVAGDTLYVYLYDQNQSNPAQENRFIRLRVEELLFSRSGIAPYQQAYFVRWSDADGNLARSLGDGLNAFLNSLPLSYEGGFSKKGTVKISSLPDIGQTDFDIPTDEVHVFGRMDVYVRPTVQDVTKVVVDGLYDLGKSGSSAANPHFSVENMRLTTTANSNLVSDADGYNFELNGVEAGQVVVLEDGPDAGLYTVGSVETAPPGLYLNRKLTSSGTVRYRIVKDIRLNLFEPRVAKFPFGDAEQADLNSTIGEKLVTFSENDLLLFGAKAGDTLRILDGSDAGDYVIDSFDQVLGGKGVYLDRPLTHTDSSLLFEVFTPLNPVERPLVRLRELLLLDSAKQSTGLTIPPADPVAVVPTGSLTSAKVLGASQLQSGYVLPDFSGLLKYQDDTPLGNHAALDGDRRYSMGFDVADGTYVSFEFPDGTHAELDLRSDTSGKTSFFVATTESFNDLVNYPPVDPRVDECLTIKNGPNKGSYLIKAVHKFKYKVDNQKTAYVYFIQVYGSFPVDPLKQILTFLEQHGQTTGLEVDPSNFPLPFPAFFQIFWNELGPRLMAALGSSGDVPTAEEAQAVIEATVSCQYEWGVPARGVLRSYFREPTLFEQRTADAEQVTTYAFKTATEEVVRFRPDPSRYKRHEVIPARLLEDAEPSAYPRDVEADFLLPIGLISTPFAVGVWVTGQANGATGRIEAIRQGNVYVLSNVVGSFFPGEGVVGDPAGAGVVGDVGIGLSNSARFADDSKPSIFSAGVIEGDELTVHEEIFLNSDRERQLLVKTTAGSPQVTAVAYDIPQGPFPSSLAGALLFIDEGDERGGYRVTKVVDGWNLILDRALSTSTPTITAYGVNGSVAFSDPLDVLSAQGGTTPFTASHVGSYVTIFAIDHRWMGSFKITGVLSAGAACSIEAPAGSHFPVAPMVGALWAITAAPSSPPDAVTRAPAPTATPSTTTVAGYPIRVYESIPVTVKISLVEKDPASSACSFSGPISNGFFQPYHITRPNVRRITPSELDAKRDGFLYYFDTEVVSLSPSSSANLAADSYLTPDDGTFESIGYRHVVVDPSFSYSMKETGYIDLPPFVLPVGSVDAVDSLVRVLGTPLQISYERSDLVSLVQDFCNSASDRPLGTSILARHFLPAYVSYDATYVGGSEPSVISKDVRDKIDRTAVGIAVDVSEIEQLITDRGGDPDTPTKVSATTYDWDRRMWTEFSENEIGGAGSVNSHIPYNGSPRVTAFVPGQDVSGLDTLPVGERINLVRR